MSEETNNEIKLTPGMETVVEQVENMTVLELSNLVKVLEEKFGVSAAAPVAVAAAPGGGSEGGEAAAAEKTSFDVILTSFGSGKIGVIKEVRGLTGLGLKEAKELVDGVPSPLKEGVSKEEAEKIKAAMEGAGAAVEVK